MENVPRIPTTPSQPQVQVRAGVFNQVHFVEVVQSGEVLLELPCTDAINVALQIIATASAAMTRQLARALPQTWPYTLPIGPDDR